MIARLHPKQFIHHQCQAMHKVTRPLRLRWRRFTAPLRVLPDFIIIGTQKGGTTSLYNYLSAHPFIMPAARKEVHFFDTHEVSGTALHKYRSHFPMTISRNAVGIRLGRKPLCLEASPEYLYEEQVPALVAKTLPNIKLIAILRNPIDRAYSQYQMNRRRNIEPLEFAEAIEKEYERITQGVNVKSVTHIPPEKHALRLYSYQSRGYYAEQLERWFKYFPRENFHIFQSEKLFENTSEEFCRVQQFLGIPEWEPRGYGVHWDGGEYEPISPIVREKLRAHFNPYNEKLYQLLGCRFDWD